MIVIKRSLFVFVFIVSTFGIVSEAYAIGVALRPSSYIYYQDMIYLSSFFILLAPWSLRLPSGSMWRPAMAVIAGAVFLLPPELVILLPVPGLILITAKSKSTWWTYPLTIGHVNASFLSAALVIHSLSSNGTLRFPHALGVGVLALLIHVTVNRLLSAGIIAFRKNKNYLEQLRLIIQELGWSHISLYTVAITMAILYQSEGVWGLALILALLVGQYKMVSYYSRMELLKKAALTDGLTGSENRFAWETFCKEISPKTHAGTLALIDLDFFKLVNDEFGHAVGDEILQQLVHLFQTRMRKHSRLFRYGGDEFILFVSHSFADQQNIHLEILKISDEFTKISREKGLPVTASCGMAVYPTDSNDVHEVFRLADVRMYQEKSARKQVAAGNHLDVEKALCRL